MTLSNEELRTRMNASGPPTARLFRTLILEIDQDVGFVRLEATATPEFCNPMGSVQGGIVSAIMDDAAAFAVIAKSAARVAVPTLEFKTTFLAPARAGQLFAEARVIKMGKRIAFIEAKLFAPDGELLAFMSVTAMLIPMPANPNLIARTEQEAGQ